MPRILIVTGVVALLHALLCTPPALADAAATQALLDLLTPIRSFSADFEQRVIDRDGSELQRSSGAMVVARGNRFRWDTKLPWPQQLVSNGTTLWQYDVDLDQVVERRFDAQLSDTPGLLLAGNTADIESQYDISDVSSGATNAQRFQLRPKRPDSIFTLLEVEFVDEEPVQILLTDGFGQRTELRFANSVRNASIEDDLFELQLPPGVDVLSDGK